LLALLSVSAPLISRPFMLPSHRAAAAPPVETKRWAVLFVYNWIGFSQSMVWVTYSASAPEARALYGDEAMDKAS